MHALDKTAWEVLNATADDWENLEQIYHLISLDFSAEHYEDRQRGAYYLRPARGAASLQEIAERITSLVQAGLLAARLEESGSTVSDPREPSYVWRAWFHMTAEGRRAWEASEHLVEKD